MLKSFRFIIFTFILSFSAQKAVADISENICQTFLPVIEQSLYLRQQGAPLETARTLAKSARNINMDLYGFVDAAIRVAYANPAGLKRMISSGELLEACVESVRGY